MEILESYDSFQFLIIYPSRKNSINELETERLQNFWKTPVLLLTFSSLIPNLRPNFYFRLTLQASVLGKPQSDSKFGDLFDYILFRVVYVHLYLRQI